MINGYNNFKYVDFASSRQNGFRNNIVSLDRIPGLVKTYGRYDCFSTYFLFTKEVFDYMNGNLVKGKPSVSGFNGMLYAAYFPLDIDCKDLELAKKTTLKALEALKYLGIDDAGLRIYFSGSKGFHLECDSRLFGIKPSKNLNLYFSKMRRKIAKAIEDKGLIDQQIKDAVRLWRLPNTINSKSGLYKVRLYNDEFKELDINDIKNMARYKRTLYDTDSTGMISRYDIGLNNKANQFYLESINSVNRSLKGKKSYAQNGNGSMPNGMCEAKKRIYQSHVDEGNRNNCALILASYFRESGKDFKIANKLLSGWNQRNNIGLPVSEIETVVRNAYNKKEPYSFGCSSLLKYCPFAEKNDCDFYRK